MVAFSDFNWVNIPILAIPVILGVYATITQPLTSNTLIWAFIFTHISGLGITAGYHRYWSHRAYEATLPMRIYLMLAGSSALEGSIKWWSRDHRAHHRYTDTSKDPYEAQRGLLWSHLGWMVFKQDPDRIGRVDISDLNRDALVVFQHKYYLYIGPFMSFVFPALVAHYGWNDFWGGFFYAGMCRQVLVHHATFCVNSLAHYLGEATYDDRRTPRDHFITALVTMGEGYHNFHHEFPSDYRNAILFWQWDPTKWFIYVASLFGLTYNLNTFVNNEIQKGRLQMEQKRIDKMKSKLNWGTPLEELPSWEWSTFTSKVEKDEKLYLVIDKVVYDVTQFIDHHPGGRGFLKTSIGRDMTASFNGAIYYHSNAARNLSSQMRVATVTGPIPEDSRSQEE